MTDEESTLENETHSQVLPHRLSTHLMHSSPVGIVLSSVHDGRIHEVNDAFLRLFQYDRSEVLGRTSRELGMWADPDLRSALVSTLYGSPALRDFEATVITRNGELRQVLVSVDVIDLEGNHWLLSHLFDVTERRRLEDELRHRERRYHAIFDNTFQFTGLLNTEGILLEANQTALDFGGLALEDVIGRPFWEAHWWTRSAETQERLRDAISQAARGEFVRYEVDVRGRAETVATIDFSLKPLRDESGQITHLIPEGRNINALRQTEAALLESEERFRSAFEWSPIGMALVGLDGRWLEVNRSLCEIVGYSENELRARTFQDITHPDDLEADLALARRLYCGEIPSYQLEKRYIRGDGQIVWVLLTGSLIHGASGSPLYALAQVVDISARKQAELETERALEVQRAANIELNRFTQAQRNFLSVVSHDFRTPLTSILGFSEILQGDSGLPREATEFAGIIAGNARRLTRMIDDLLTLDRLEARREPAPRQPVDLESVLSEVASIFHANGATHHIAIDIEPDLPFIMGDRDGLIRVLTNLVDNAVKYSPQGGPITIVAQRAADAVHLEVRDQGIGIPASDLEMIFDPYARVTAETTRRIRGTGLGLAIVREIIDAHGGRAWAESDLGVGSTFHIVLPTPDE
jgi:PAS domain S-box-containing protein